MYCAWRIPAHLRCTQCSICFLTCICLWQISQIQTFLFKVVGPGLVSTSPSFVSSSASHPAGPHGRLAQKTVNRAPIAGGGKVRHNLHSSFESTVTAPPLVGCVVWSHILFPVVVFWEKYKSIAKFSILLEFTKDTIMRYSVQSF